jgi:hypothetical protein
MRRRNTPWTLVAAAGLLLAGHATSASADSVASFRLSNTNPTGSAPIMTVFAGILPAGAVVPPVGQDPNNPPSPLKILSNSAGFNPQDFTVSTDNALTPSGQPIEALRIDFYHNNPNNPSDPNNVPKPGDGLQAGGVLNFSLNLSSTLTQPLQLLLPPDSNGLDLVSFGPTAPDTPPPGSPPPTTGGGGQSVPEPLSVAVWVSLTGLAWIRIRRTGFPAGRPTSA